MSKILFFYSFIETEGWRNSLSERETDHIFKTSYHESLKSPSITTYQLDKSQNEEYFNERPVSSSRDLLHRIQSIFTPYRKKKKRGKKFLEFPRSCVPERHAMSSLLSSGPSRFFSRQNDLACPWAMEQMSRQTTAQSLSRNKMSSKVSQFILLFVPVVEIDIAEVNVFFNW